MRVGRVTQAPAHTASTSTHKHSLPLPAPVLHVGVRPRLHQLLRQLQLRVRAADERQRGVACTVLCVQPGACVYGQLQRLHVPGQGAGWWGWWRQVAAAEAVLCGCCAVWVLCCVGAVLCGCCAAWVLCCVGAVLCGCCAAATTWACRGLPGWAGDAPFGRMMGARMVLVLAVKVAQSRQQAAGMYAAGPGTAHYVVAGHHSAHLHILGWPWKPRPPP